MPRRHPSRTSRPPSGRARDDDRPSALGSHRQADGTAKTSYMSRGEACLVAEERLEEVGVELDVYRCPTCSAWHLGKPVDRDG